MATIMLEDFEDATVNYTLLDTDGTTLAEDASENNIRNFFNRTTFTDAATNDFNITDASGTGAAGSSFFAFEDYDHIPSLGATVGSSDIVVMQFTVDITNFSNLSFSGLFARDTADDGNEDWDALSSLIITASIDGGAAQTVLAIEAQDNSSFAAPAVDTNGDGIGDGTVLTDTFQTLSGNITGTGTTLVLTITVTELDTGTENIAIDNITVSGDAPLTGDGDRNVLVGDANDNIILGLGGNDKLEGGLGADSLNGGEGIDTAKYINAASAVIVDLINGGTGGEATGDTYTSIERVTGSQFDDTITGDGNANILIGRDGADTLNGGAGNDNLFGGAGADIVNGDAGNDRLHGDAGADAYDGGADFDRVEYLKSSSGVTVNIDDTANGVGDAQGDTYANIEQIFLSNFADTFIGSATAADDVVYGWDGEDILMGNAGDDRLYGNDGADTLNGGDGIDRLKGGTGDDILTGGADRDAFFFEVNAGADTITDFENGTDIIIFQGSPAGVNGFADLTIAQSGDDVTVTYGTNVLTLSDTMLADIDAGDFGFI